MKKTLLFCLIFACSFLCVDIFASEAAPFAGQCIDGKLYVEPGTVYVAPDGIFIRLEGNFVPVEAVFVDEGGVYVDLGERKCKHSLYCDRCKGCHPDNTCRFRCKCPPRP